MSAGPAAAAVLGVVVVAFACVLHLVHVLLAALPMVHQ